jgi:hypothetical protein
MQSSSRFQMVSQHTPPERRDSDYEAGKVLSWTRTPGLTSGKSARSGPRISHLPGDIDTRTRKERQAEKEAVADERRAIKKAARRHLQEQLRSELEEAD